VHRELILWEVVREGGAWCFCSGFLFSTRVVRCSQQLPPTPTAVHLQDPVGLGVISVVFLFSSFLQGWYLAGCILGVSSVVGVTISGRMVRVSSVPLSF